MTAREELAELIKRTNTAMGREADAMKQVTPEEMLRLWRGNVAFRQMVGPAANELLRRYDAEEREEAAKRKAETYSSFAGAYGFEGIDLHAMLDDLIKDLDNNRRQREFFEQRWNASHAADAFGYAMGGRANPFARSDGLYGRSPAQQPANPERVAALAQARKIKALADDSRGNSNQRDVARRKLADLTAKHGFTAAELR